MERCSHIFLSLINVFGMNWRHKALPHAPQISISITVVFCEQQQKLVNVAAGGSGVFVLFVIVAHLSGRFMQKK